MMGTWSKKVSGYIALTDFQKQKMVKGGLPADKVWVKPNFIAGGDGVKSEGLSDKKNQSEAADPILKKPDLKTGDPYALYVGRLSPEKGCDVLIHAWSKLVSRWRMTRVHSLGLLVVGLNVKIGAVGYRAGLAIPHNLESVNEKMSMHL